MDASQRAESMDQSFTALLSQSACSDLTSSRPRRAGGETFLAHRSAGGLRPAPPSFNATRIHTARGCPWGEPGTRFTYCAPRRSNLPPRRR